MTISCAIQRHKSTLFPLNADFPAFSHRIFRETSRNLSDERLQQTPERNIFTYSIKTSIPSPPGTGAGGTHSCFKNPPFTNPCFTNPPFTNPCFTNPPFTNPCFTNPCFTNPCFTNPVHVLQIQSNPVHSMFYNMPFSARKVNSGSVTHDVIVVRYSSTDIGNGSWPISAREIKCYLYHKKI